MTLPGNHKSLKSRFTIHTFSLLCPICNHFSKAEKHEWTPVSRLKDLSINQAAFLLKILNQEI